MKILRLVTAPFLAMVLMTAANASSWSAGDEFAYFGHTFEEEYWYTTIENTTEEGDELEFGISFANMGDIEAFLITLNTVEDQEGNVGALPYQMFGMHYFTKDGEEVFLGAVLAFLCVYNDTNANSVPNVGERFFYVIPFGIGNVLEGTYPPTVTNMGVEKVGDDHFRMGVTYTNMYAIASENPILTAKLLTGWVVKFSELSIIYDIKVDRSTGNLTAETYYTIGQVTALYAVILGIPLEVADIPAALQDDLGIGAVHFTTVVTSGNLVPSKDGVALDTNRDEVVNGLVELRSGDIRAFSVGLRGTYDLIDETTSGTIANDQDALNMILAPKLNDLLLVAWQLGFSARVFSYMAYGLSANVRGEYSSASDLENKSLDGTSLHGLGARAFWYGVFFPGWNGYRVEHDPVYTAYFGEDPGTIEDDAPGFEPFLILIPMLAAIPALIALGRRKR